MKKLISNKLFEIVSVIIFAVLIATLIESFTYVGFFKKHFLIDTNYLLILAAFFAGIYLFLKNKKDTIKFNFLLRINNIILIVSLVVYFLLLIVESVTFSNFVFSKFHFNINNFVRFLILPIVLCLVGWLKMDLKVTYKKKRLIVRYFSFIFIFLLLLPQLGSVFNSVMKENIYMLRHIQYNYDQKMFDKWGFFYEYMEFVKTNTPENASILVPPQETPWLSTGNVGFVRYFLYPRILVNGNKSSLPEIMNFDYILLDWGEWTNADINSYGWPKVTVDAEKIIYMGGDGKTAKTVYSPYKPTDKENFEAWGLIKVKK